VPRASDHFCDRWQTLLGPNQVQVRVSNKLGFPKTYPNGITFAPTSRVLGAAGLFDLRIDQGVYNIKEYLDFVGTDQKAGNVMVISLCHLQVESGLGYPP
jgi:hypothetical protein